MITILLQDHIHWVLARILGGIVPRMPRNVKGIWRSHYTYPSKSGDDKEERQLIELRQFGKYVLGRNLTGRHHWYKMRGKLELQMYFTGIWENTSDSDIFHGAFQFVVSPEGNTMKGKWIGFGDNHQVNHGPWEWELITRETDHQTKNEIVEKEVEKK